MEFCGELSTEELFPVTEVKTHTKEGLKSNPLMSLCANLMVGNL